ncbi:LysR substrate-binding domain-containing protein, partial [Devosia psychrophila]|uniref:LysR substrate-binding domain-containing protein n=1 Tax=Devosia psychrophila TaxID=728005 RepID=UPI000AE24193
AVLFERTRRTVSLTPAGHRLLVDARKILAAIDDAAYAVKRTADGDEGTLRIGLTPSAPFNIVVPSILRAYRSRFPAVDFAISESNTPALMEALRRGAVDGAFLRPTDIDTTDLTITTVLQEPMLAAIPAHHPLAEAESIALEDLKSETVILRPRPIGERLTKVILAACEQTGFSPIITQKDAPQMTSILSLVAAGLGITFVPASMSRFLEGFVAYKPVRDSSLPEAILSFARLEASSSPTLSNFEKIALTLRDELGTGSDGPL